MKLFVIEGDEGIEGKTLNLVYKDEMIYFCIDNNIEIIDTWDEIFSIYFRKDKRVKEFYRMHLFTQDIGEGLHFISSVKLIKE